jgi:molybdopterin/thiamine biosynthesis adenylyltransferase
MYKIRPEDAQKIQALISTLIQIDSQSPLALQRKVFTQGDDLIIHDTPENLTKIEELLLDKKFIQRLTNEEITIANFSLVPRDVEEIQSDYINDMTGRIVEAIETFLYSQEGAQKASAEGRRLWFDESTLQLTIVDFDRIEDDNFSKASALIVYPDDVGQSKAAAVARRCRPILAKGCRVNAIHDDIHSFGPVFFSQYDVIVLAVDNFAAKWHVNQMWLQTENRPRMIFTGTFGAYAEAGLLDGSGPCLRCTWDDDWLKEASRRTSCRAAYREAERQGVVPTSALASSVAANLVMQLLLYFAADNSAFLNKRIKYLPAPDSVQIDYDIPLRRSCGDCKLSPAAGVQELDGDVLHMTMPLLFEAVGKKLGTLDFRVEPVTEFVAYDFCPVCGRRRDVMRPLGRLSKEDVTCPEHRGQPDNAALPLEQPGIVEFSPYGFSTAVAALPLYELGFRIGGVIEVKTGVFPAEERCVFTCAGVELSRQDLALYQHE